MPLVMLRYRPIQYVEDTFRGEGRNIGVITYGDAAGHAHFRSLGDQNSDRTNLAPFSCLSRMARDNAWVFGEWAAWFRSLAYETQVSDVRLQYLLDKLEDDGASFIAGKEGVLEIPEGEPIEKAVAWLYSRLVREPQPRNANFLDVLENLMAQSRVMYKEGYERDIEIEFTPVGSDPVRISADFALTGTIKAVFKVIRFKGTREHLIKRVNDVIYTFQQAVVHGFAPKGFCFVLSDKPTQQNEDLHLLLSRYGVTINVLESSAGQQIEQILNSSVN